MNKVFAWVSIVLLNYFNNYYFRLKKEDSAKGHVCFGIFKVFNSSKTNLSSIIDCKNKIRSGMALTSKRLKSA
jgi:hypothetical protein